MNSRRRRIWLSLAVALSLAVFLPGSVLAEAPVKNVILLIGDGMGINQITAARINLEAGAHSVLNLDTMPYTGFSINFANNNLITDSASAATALATCFRTDTGRLGTLPDGTPVQSIMLKARKWVLSTGIVATVKVTMPRPQAFLVFSDSGLWNGTSWAVLAAGPMCSLGGGADALGTPSLRSPNPTP